MTYILEVYQAGSDKNLWARIESDQAFLSIHRGDFVSPGAWEGSEAPLKTLRVVAVEHLVRRSKKDEEIRHLLMVYTEDVDTTDGSYLFDEGVGR